MPDTGTLTLLYGRPDRSIFALDSVTHHYVTVRQRIVALVRAPDDFHVLVLADPRTARKVTVAAPMLDGTGDLSSATRPR